MAAAVGRPLPELRTSARDTLLYLRPRILIQGSYAGAAAEFRDVPFLGGAADHADGEYGVNFQPEFLEPIGYGPGVGLLVVGDGDEEGFGHSGG